MDEEVEILEEEFQHFIQACDKMSQVWKDMAKVLGPDSGITHVSVLRLSHVQTITLVAVEYAI